MTNEERRKAAEWFGNRAKNCPMPGARRMYEIATEALDMAVRALEQNLVQESGGLVKDLVNDCISRKMAIDAFEPEHDTDWYTPQIIEVLEALPPVQPTQTNADSTQSNTLDCVSRRAAMIVIENSGLDDDSKDTVVRVLEQLPSAQPETHDKRTETHECDLISRQQAIGAVVSAMIDGADAELVEGVMELLPPAQPQWIPSSERMPDRDGKYIVTTPRYKYVRVRDFSLKYWWEDGTPTAWMPLPKPYGGESDGT